VRLPTNYQQDAPVAEDEEHQDDGVERREVPDAVRQLGGAALPESHLQAPNPVD